MLKRCSDSLPWDLFPRLESCDVVVCGGGPSGTVAAIAAARAGARTLIVERYGFLGGALTSQGVHPMMTFHAGTEQVVCGIPDEVVQRMVQAGASPGHITDSIGYASSVTPFSAEGLKIALEELVSEAGGQVLYHAMLADAEVCDGQIRRILVCTKAGLQTIDAAVFVDATGDGDLLEYAGVEFSRGRGQDGATQPMTANFRVANVDIAVVRRYILEHPDEFYLRDLRDVETAPRLSVSGFYDHVRRARAAGEFPTDRKGILFFETNTPGEVNVNSTHIFGKDAADPKLLSEAEAEGRAQAMQVFAFLRKWIPGFENAVHLGTGVQIGVRESRRLNGAYTLTEADLLEGRTFDDAIAMGGYPVDIHPPTPEDARASLAASSAKRELERGDTYQIPYRILISPQCDNLIVSGRCVSANHEALGAIRVTPIAMAMGQAAGTAAAMAAQAQQPVDSVDTAELRRRLAADGARLP